MPPRSSGHHRRTGLWGRNSRPRARLLSGRRAGGLLRGACSRKDAPCFGRGARAALQSPSLSRTSLPYDDVEGRRSAGQASRGEGQATQRAAHWKPLPSQHPGARRNAPGSRAGNVARRGAGDPAASNSSPTSSGSKHRRAISTASLRRVHFRGGSPSTRARLGPSSVPRVSTEIFGATILTRTTPNSPLTAPILTEGDAYARARVRIAEVEAAFVLCQRVLLLLEPGEVRAECVPGPFPEALVWAEGPRGAQFYVVHVAGDGRLARVKIQSPSFSTWKVFPYTVGRLDTMDYAINEASFSSLCRLRPPGGVGGAVDPFWAGKREATTWWPGRRIGRSARPAGRPRDNPGSCRDGTRRVREGMPTQAIEARGERPFVDYGRCVVCQLCTERARQARWNPPTTGRSASVTGPTSCGRRRRRDRQEQYDPIRPRFTAVCTFVTSTPVRGRLRIRTPGLNNPFYNLHRFGISSTPSPRFADRFLSRHRSRMRCPSPSRRLTPPCPNRVG